MVSSCSAVGCKERAVKGCRMTFHRFPKNPDLRDKWIKALKRKDFEPTKNSRVCEKHFSDEAYNHFASRKKLQKNAVPEIFDFYEFVKDGLPKIQKLEDTQRIHCIQFVDVDGAKSSNFLPSQNRTVIVIDNAVIARCAEKPHSHVTMVDANTQSDDITSIPVIKSSFSLNYSVLRESVVSAPLINDIPTQSSFSLNTCVPQDNAVSVPSVENTLSQSSFSPSRSSPGVTKTPESAASRIPDVLVYDCIQKRLIHKALQMKKKFEERLKVMNHVSRHLEKRKTFLETLLIRIKEKQLTSCEEVADLMNCFIEENSDEETLSTDEDSSNAIKEHEKAIAFIDGKISKFEKAIKIRNGLPNSSECEAFGLHLESVLNTMPMENAANVKNQISEVLKKYQGNRWLTIYRDFNKTFSGLENIEMNEIE